MSEKVPHLERITVMEVADEGGFESEALERWLKNHYYASGSNEEQNLLKRVRGIFRYYKITFNDKYAKSEEGKKFLKLRPDDFERLYESWVKEAGKV